MTHPFSSTGGHRRYEPGLGSPVFSGALFFLASPHAITVPVGSVRVGGSSSCWLPVLLGCAAGLGSQERTSGGLFLRSQRRSSVLPRPLYPALRESLVDCYLAQVSGFPLQLLSTTAPCSFKKQKKRALLDSYEMATSYESSRALC